MRDLLIDPICFIYGKAKEDLTHFILMCGYARMVWKLNQHLISTKMQDIYFDRLIEFSILNSKGFTYFFNIM